jgi:ABC-2 type transport system ATP-binding protein
MVNIKVTFNELLSWFELDPRKPIREYSKGMKRRITLAQAFLGEPDLVILDEPLNGLDPLVIVKLRNRLNEKRNKGTGLLYSSHILSEVEKCCSRAIILNEGKLVLDAPLDAIQSEYGSIENAFAKTVGDS